jgi:PTH1 family peptidyl-tRNA hydrolase
MAFLQRRPQVSNPVNYITVGLNKTVLLIGLGNPGPAYDRTRHNIGFACIDSFVKTNTDMGGWIDKKDLKCLFSSGQLGQTRVIAIKPTTFMNLSGEAVQAVTNFYKIPLDQTLAVYDELDIEFGHIRTRVGGSSAGHNGVKSVISAVGEDFGRVRVGIGPKHPEQMDTADFVLQKFSTEQQTEMSALLREVNAVLSEVAFGSTLAQETRNFLL